MFHVRKLKNFNITSKYFSIFNNKPPTSWVAHRRRDFITCYSCFYYSFLCSYLQYISDIFMIWERTKENVIGFLENWDIPAQKIKFFIKNIFSKCYIYWMSHLLKELLIEKFFFYLPCIKQEWSNLNIFFYDKLIYKNENSFLQTTLYQKPIDQLLYHCKKLDYPKSLNRNIPES